MRNRIMFPKHKRKFFGILFLFFLYASTAGSMLWFNVASQHKPGSFGVADTLKTIPHKSDAVIDVVYVAESCANVRLPSQNDPSRSTSLVNVTAITAIAPPTPPKISVSRQQPLPYNNIPLCKPVHESNRVSEVCLHIRTVILLS